MRLYLNKASPYARLVLVVAHEKSLADRLELAWTDPWSSPQQLVAANPFSKVPTLVTDEGEAIVDSACICDYLEEIGNGRRLLALQGSSRLLALRKYAMGRGLIDAAFGVTIQRRYGESGGKSFLVERWLAALSRGIAHLEHNKILSTPSELPDMGDLAITVGLSYTEFRLPEVVWRADAPQLCAWFDRFAVRPSMRLSTPE